MKIGYGSPAEVSPEVGCHIVLPAMDGPGEKEPRQLELVVSCAVCLLKEDYCYFVGVSKVMYDF